MAGLNRRVHVLLDDDRLERLRQHAEASGSSVGAVVRDAIDRELQRDDRTQALAALESFLAVPAVARRGARRLNRELEEMMDEELD